MRIAISAGEASGDAYGAALVRELRDEPGLSDVQTQGMGGPRMRQAGVELVADTSTWGAISIVQSLSVVPRALTGYRRMRRLLSQGEPGLFVPIDFGWVNIRLARLAKARGWKVLYFIPPGSWRRDRQGKDLASVTDAVVTPFPWSRDLLSAGGVNTHWFGHPLRQLMRDIRPANESGRVGIAVLPGSRKHEIEANLPLIATSLPDLPATFALAPTVDADRFRREWRALAPERKGDQFVQGRAAEVLAKARLALVCSGTATLEAVLCRCPMVVIYRVNRAMAIEAKVINFKRPKFIALPNILLDEAVVPELVQDEAVDRVIDDLLRRLAPDGEARAKQLVAFERLIDQLGPDQAITETARLAARLLL